MTPNDPVIGLLADANPVSDPNIFALSMVAATRDKTIGQGTKTLTETELRSIEPPTTGRNRRGWLVAAAAAALILIVGIGTGIVVGQNLDESPADSPLEVGDTLNEAIMSGNWGAARRLYADDATFSDPFATELLGDASLHMPMAGPIEPSYEEMVLDLERSFDWDEDGIISLFDTEADWTMALYEGYPFRTSEPILASNTFTVVDGRITHQTYTPDLTTPALLVEASLMLEYHEWVRVNRPESVDQLFWQFGVLRVTPDTLETHREFIAEWQAQR